MVTKNKSCLQTNGDRHLQSVYDAANRLLGYSGIMATTPDCDFLCPYTLKPCTREMYALLKYREDVISLSEKDSHNRFFEVSSAWSTYSYCGCVECEIFKTWVGTLPKIPDMPDAILRAHIPLLQRAHG